MLLVILRKACRFSRYISLAFPAGQWQTLSHTRGQYLSPQRPINCDMPASLSSILFTCPPLQRKGSKQLTRSKASERSEEPHTALREAKAVEARRERRGAAFLKWRRLKAMTAACLYPIRKGGQDKEALSFALTACLYYKRTVGKRGMPWRFSCSSKPPLHGL